jgi:hypothetical protein
MRPDAVSPAQWRALLRLVSALDAAGIPYQLSGGLAGNVHGSAWPLHDIDLDVPGARIAQVAALFPGEAAQGPARFVDDEFDVVLLRLELDGVPVDVSSADDAWIFTRTGVRTPLRIDLARAERRPFRGTSLFVAPLDDLIAYKQLLGRDRDVADLLRLRSAGRGNGP